ncbi:MAG: hypothetical protein EWV49_18060 [Microcystis aeruginosa Ma_QC_Ch_20071001_S25]|jgi:hypothetical protein|uniref:Uncharacterized protein n=1 Tax=Microcystis aeruginosa Ma_QC_Ch_20071001_S25D TaxID=2486250 RepID=A0A552G6B7_MICAE|nr:MAG: hypothetical protein EWV49_18060 [Microcystis aeruginosa Ma_QC_Ch_20071001_S25]TRU54510.1 MAG: hypothetical protein EWV57_01580 [Microcystis aeruginosa Ma_QC_Ch_20071001_S25D]TRU60115.1 MAG: hypothetical protein EWV90_15570 [Microcystis aeruginosa Ma_QC_Ch_20071001_M135]
MYKTLTAVIIAAATNCPLVDVAGKYTLDLKTESATVWSDSPNSGCRSSGLIGGLAIQPDGLMTASRQSLIWINPSGTRYHTDSTFGGRVEPGSEPMQWVGSAGDVEFKGTWRRGQLSGEFVRRFVYDGKQIECRGKVSGFKMGK